MNIDTSSVKVGDLVKVKPGVLDPDACLVSSQDQRERFFDHDVGAHDTKVLSLEGWQGKVIGVRPQEDGITLIDIEWDRQTLQNMPKQVIEACEKDGLSWTEMALYPDDVDVLRC